MIVTVETVIWQPVARHVERLVEYVPVRRQVEVEVTPEAQAMARHLGKVLDARLEKLEGAR